MRFWQLLPCCMLLLLASGCPEPTVDLVAQGVSGPDTHVLWGDPLTVPNEVCNLGVLPSEPAGVTFWLRPEGDVMPPTPIGWRPLPAMAYGECSAEVTPLSVPSGIPDGGYRLMAIGDWEGQLDDSDRSNNVALSDPFGIGYGADLVVENFSAPASTTSGSPFPLHAEVCNRGNDWSVPTQILFLLSDDAEISFEPPVPDFWAGDFPVQHLAPGECAAIDEMAQVYAPDGAYTVGAVVDASQSVVELLDSNNITTAGPIGIGFGPDLVVSQLSGPPSTQNGAFDYPVVVEVCNVGTTPSPMAMMSLHFSADETITPSFPDPAGGDPMLAPVSVSELDPGSCETKALEVSAWAPTDGAWYLGAVVDFDESLPELIESNNTRVGNPVGVGSGPDYVVSQIEAPPSASGPIDFQLELCNQGTGPGDPTILQVFLSSDAQLDPLPEGNDPEVGGFGSPTLAAGECISIAVPGYVDPSLDIGPYRMVARVDGFGDVEELLESNNDTWGGVIGIGDAPDYRVDSISGPPSVPNGSDFQLTSRVCNQGTQSMGATQLSVYLSDDANIAGIPAGPAGPIPPDWWAGDIAVPDLMPGACATVVGMAHASVGADGEYVLGAIVDDPNWIVELIETNNSLAGPVIGVGAGPDLKIESLTGPPSALAGGDQWLDFEVCNSGTTMSDPTSLALYLSDDDQIQGVGSPMEMDHWLSDAPIPGLDKDACFAGSHEVHIPTESSGAPFVGGIVDESNLVTELVESNNSLAQHVIGIGSGPDFVVADITVPPSSTPSGPMPVSVDVCNQGTVAGGGPGTVALFLSDDANLDGSYLMPGADMIVYVYPLPALLPGDCQTEWFDIWPSLPGPEQHGAWHLIGVADAGDYETELREDNNERVSDVVGIGDAPDLVVTNLSVPGTVSAGTLVTITGDVCNQGTQPAPAVPLSLYYSADAVVTGDLEEPGNVDVLVGIAWTAPLLPGSCEPISLDTTPPVAPGTWYVGGIVDEDGSVSELIETNNRTVTPAHEVVP